MWSNIYKYFSPKVLKWVKLDSSDGMYVRHWL